MGAYAGLPACVLASKLCAVIQQSYLDSHRAKMYQAKRFDMASSFVQGGPETIIISSKPQVCPWQSKLGEYYLCKTQGLHLIEPGYVVGTYSSELLAMMDERYRHAAAVKGITFLAKYYQVRTSEVEVDALADAIVNECEVSTVPPTVAGGVGQRSYRWLTKIVAQHWKKILEYESDLGTKYNVDTRVEACVFGNFSRLPSVLDHPKRDTTGV